MRTVKWTNPARRSAEAYLDYLQDRNPAAAKQASDEIQAISRRLNLLMTPGRPSMRWPGFRELSLNRWHKLIVFKILDDRISVTAFFDTRQNLDVVAPSDE